MTETQESKKETQGSEEKKRLDLDNVDEDYKEWVVCEPIETWEKNGMECVLEEKRWYRKPVNDPDAEEELMTESYIGVVHGPEGIKDVPIKVLNEALEIDQPNGVVKRGRYVGFDTLHNQLVEEGGPKIGEIRDEVEWVCEQLVMQI